MELTVQRVKQVAPQQVTRNGLQSGKDVTIYILLHTVSTHIMYIL